MTCAGQTVKWVMIKGQLARIRLHGLELFSVIKIICDVGEMTMYHVLKIASVIILTLCQAGISSFQLLLRGGVF